MSQCERILRHLRDYRTITPIEALSEYGCMRLGARIFDLKKMGYNIKKTTTKGTNRYGEPTHYATYSLEE